MSDDPLVPVLTEIVDEASVPAPAVTRAALEAMARELEQAVLSRLAPEVDRVIDGVRAELMVGVTRLVREAIAASVADALASPPRRD